MNRFNKYNRKAISQRAMVKVGWSFVMQVSEGFGFSDKFRQLIYAYLSLASFPISINETKKVGLRAEEV